MNAILHPTLISALENVPRIPCVNGTPDSVGRWAEDPNDQGAKEIVATEQGQFVLSWMFSGSPYLTMCSLQERGFLVRCFLEGTDTVFERLLDEMIHLIPGTSETFDFNRLNAELRRTRRRVSLLIAFAEVTGVWDTQQAAIAQSRFADHAVALTINGLLLEAHKVGEIKLEKSDSPGDGSGLIVLALGKLGGYELNYSSDIDLMILYDLDRCRLSSKVEARDFFVRLARRLVDALATRTSDGYMFRTDLRLRPDPGATPLAISTVAAETYYESLGQNWERAALIKARSIAGDHEAAANFLKSIEPFIWRKSLDFAAIADIHSIKQQINSHRGGSAITIKGHNLKLGRGGIREIEFFAQTQQLIWGGRSRNLRVPSTCDALAALASENRITEKVCNDLTSLYWRLRRVENRLQMVNDSQVHTIPENDQNLDQFSRFLGYVNTSQFSSELHKTLQKVAWHYSNLFENAPKLIAPFENGGSLVFTGVDYDPETQNTLREMGFPRPELITDSVRSWHRGRLRATRSTRSRELLTQLMPTLLLALSKTAEPEAAFINFEQFLSNLPAGVQLFSLFQARPKLLDIVAEVMGTAPRLASYLARHAHLLEAVLEEHFFDLLEPSNQLSEKLRAKLKFAQDFEDVLDITRIWSGEIKFQISVQHLRGLIKTEQASKALTDIADILIKETLLAVENEFRRTYGQIIDGELAVVGFGKLGSRMMTRGSDLDLVFIYQTPQNVVSNGPRKLGPSQYYSRLCQRLITALSAQTAQGQLYETDVRLRPMGASGPLVSEFSRLEKYYAEEAWTWELMALTRARIVVASDDFSAIIQELFCRTLCDVRDPNKLASQVSKMHRKVFSEKGELDIWQIKNVAGGLFDLEFIIQYLLLRDSSATPTILNSNTIEALKNISGSGAISLELGTSLLKAGELFIDLQAIMRIALSGKFSENEALDGLRHILVRASGAFDFDDLKGRLAAAEQLVTEQLTSIIHEPAETYDAGEIKKNRNR